jgi:hypothetical protein
LDNGEFFQRDLPGSFGKKYGVNNIKLNSETLEPVSMVDELKGDVWDLQDGVWMRRARRG